MKTHWRIIAAAVVGLGAASPLAEGWRTTQQTARKALGTLRGRVELRRVLPATATRPAVSDLGMPPARDTAARRRAVIYLESAPAGAFEPREGGRARLDQRNETFVPHVLAITIGSWVDFPNSDQTYHNVFSLSKTKRFDLGRYAAGHSKAVRFDQPGIVRVFCDIHSHMSAFILVFNHRFFAVTDGDDRYRIDALPAGRYTVIAWYEGRTADSRPVTVPDDGGTIEQDFVVK